MNFHKLPSLFAAAVLLGTLSLSGAITTGESAPDFTLEDTHGNTHSLSDFAGKYVVLEWLNHECPFVAKFYKAGEMQRLQEEWRENGVIWLAINSTTPSHRDYKSVEEANKLNDKHKVAHTALLMDPDGDVGKLYGARTTPHMYITSPDGELLYQGAIDSIPNARPQSIAEATNYVDVALKAALKGEAITQTDTRPYGCTVKY